MRYLLFPILLLACAGCQTRVAPTVTTGGQTGYEFNCGGLLANGVACAEQATRYCPYGYYPVVESPSRLVAVCAGADTRTAVLREPAEQPVAAAPPEEPVAQTGVPAGAYAGATGAAASFVSPAGAEPEDGTAAAGQPLTEAEKQALFRNFDAYLANQSGRHLRPR